MSFVITAWHLTLFLGLVGLLFLFLSSRAERGKKRMVQGKEILFLIGIAYIALAHFSMFVSIGQALDEEYQAPCEWVISNETISGNVTTYAYNDTCASIAAPGGSSALVVIFTWLLYCGAFGVLLLLIVHAANIARRFV